MMLVVMKFATDDLDSHTIAVIGLGYVGLPIAVAFGKKFKTIGFDKNQSKIHDLLQGKDPSGEVSQECLEQAELLSFTVDPSLLKDVNIFIIAVPTPIDPAKNPDLTPLISASKIVAENMQDNAIIIYESTVFPGATEDVCIPILEQYSGKKWLTDFNVGYSPERINPGDAEHTLQSITKVVSADSVAALKLVSDLYASIIDAGVYEAPNIKTAEAAKVIENTQRDLNIALMNELSIIFNKMDVDTIEVLKAAETKWNFLSFRPGLVGGHCIGVDPYYLTHKAEMLGYHPQVILAGRRINDHMGKFITQETIKLMLNSGHNIVNSKILILGLSFKENCNDIRNTKVMDIINELKTYDVEFHVHDPNIEKKYAQSHYQLDLKTWDELPKADAIIFSVAHNQFKTKSLQDYLDKLNPGACIIDIKQIFDANHWEECGYKYWRL